MSGNGADTDVLTKVWCLWGTKEQPLQPTLCRAQQALLLERGCVYQVRSEGRPKFGQPKGQRTLAGAVASPKLWKKKQDNGQQGTSESLRC